MNKLFWALFLLNLAVLNFSIAQSKYLNNQMLVGADYYPEHWPEEKWKKDIDLMTKAGFNVVRLAEFSWAKMQPDEDKYDFTWLDKAVNYLHQNKIKVILGTPTAVPPAWMAKKYPEILAMQKEGTRLPYGKRKETSYTSPDFIRLSKRIVEEMASHYSKSEAVIGWQIDNELEGPFNYDENTRKSFAQWLQRKYLNIDSLNSSWGTYFWGHTLYNWEEVSIPFHDWFNNPSASLDWHRFHSNLNVEFLNMQVKIIRKLCPDDFITTNMMGTSNPVNYYELGKNLDFVSWDNYPVAGKPDIPYSSSFSADLMRGVLNKNFIIMEQTAGSSGWGAMDRNPYPGEIRKAVYQQIAHGSDGQIWFNWQTAIAGREQYWHGLLGHDGKPLRRYNEAKQTSEELKRLWGDLRKTLVKSKVAIIYDYDSYWETIIQPAFSENNYPERILNYYKALFKLGINVDVISTDADLSKYQLVIAPNLSVLPDPIARKINSFISNGGVFLTDCRTGVKNETSLAHTRTLPGLLAESLGIRINEYSPLKDDRKLEIIGAGKFTKNYTSVFYNDWMTPTKAKGLLRYKGIWAIEEFSPLSVNNFGKGKAWYLGTIVKEEEFYVELLRHLLDDANISYSDDLPPGVEISYRENNENQLMFIINHTDNEVRV
ncbi:MAG TPA: beta-galactosidase, partial [Cytophagaceae bacterium]